MDESAGSVNGTSEDKTFRTDEFESSREKGSDTTALSPADVFDDVSAFLDTDLQPCEPNLTSCLEALVLGFLAIEDRGLSGAEITQLCEEMFDTSPSAGTLYPLLNELEKEGLISRREGKEETVQRIVNREQAAESLRDTMNNHLALGLFFHAALTQDEASDE
jgi:DNA-binding MarR family transcriptional regulator